MKVVFPGSFDPPTNGHLNLIRRASKVFDDVEIVIGDNGEKTNLFTVEERKEFLKEIMKTSLIKPEPQSNDQEEDDEEEEEEDEDGDDKDEDDSAFIDNRDVIIFLW